MSMGDEMKNKAIIKGDLRMVKYPLVMSEQWSTISCRGLRKNEALDCKVSQMTSIFLYRLDL